MTLSSMVLIVVLASAGTTVNAQGNIPTDPGMWRETGTFLVYYFETPDLTPEEKSFIRTSLSAVISLVDDRYRRTGVRKVVFKPGSELSSDQIDLLLRYQASHGITGIATLNLAHLSYGQATAPNGTFYGATDDRKISVVFLGNILAGTRSTATRVLRLGQVAGHELGHGLGCPGNWGPLTYLFDAFGFGTSNLMDEEQPLSSRAKFFDVGEVEVRNFARFFSHR